MAWFQVDFFSNTLHRRVPLNVLIPADAMGMSIDPCAKYPTLYLLHGYVGNCDDWLLGAGVEQLANQLKVAIVMPSGNNDFYVDAPRSEKNQSTYLSGELIDFTRRTFPLSHKREDTMIGGLSMGGFGALYNGLKHSDVFGKIVALSGPMHITEKANLDNLPDEPNFMGITKGYYEELFGPLDKITGSGYDPKTVAKELAESSRPRPEIYIACGWNDELRASNRDFSAYLDSIGIEHFYEEGPGTHEWAFWDPYLKKGLAHVMKKEITPMPNPFWVEDDRPEERM